MIFIHGLSLAQEVHSLFKMFDNNIQLLSRIIRDTRDIKIVMSFESTSSLNHCIEKLSTRIS